MSVTDAKGRKKEMNFAESVHQLVTELSVEDPTMIRWTSDGAAFRVNPSHPGLGDALSKYFQHSKYSSFQRQLNQYGWTKPRSGRYNGTFFNPSFRKDSDMEAVRKIARGGCKKHLRTVEPSSENRTPLRKNRAMKTPSPYRRRPRLPLQKKELNFAVAKTVSPLTTKSIENPSADDMTAVQVLLGMIQKPSSCSDTIVSEKSSSNRRGRNFALAVHDLVTEAHETNPNMIRWVQDGSAFEIDPSHPQLGQALAKYFQHSKFSSFQRQLNQYGWCKLRNTGKFFNQNFHQDKSKSNFDLIQRKDKKTDASLSSNRGTKRASSDVGFYLSQNKQKRRRRTSSISEPRLQPISDEDTITSEEESILSSVSSFVDLTRPPTNVTAYNMPH